jgi:hypothetical protein
MSTPISAHQLQARQQTDREFFFLGGASMELRPRLQLGLKNWMPSSPFRRSNASACDDEGSFSCDMIPTTITASSNSRSGAVGVIFSCYV